MVILELIITEPQGESRRVCCLSFRNGVFYHLTPQQRTLWKAIQDLPMDQDRKKRRHFGSNGPGPNFPIV